LERFEANIGMVRPQRLLADGQRTLVERLGLGVLPLVVIKHGQTVEAPGHIGMVLPQRRLPDGQRLLVQRLRLEEKRTRGQIEGSLIE
jgi:hypothetical protein